MVDEDKQNVPAAEEEEMAQPSDGTSAVEDLQQALVQEKERAEANMAGWQRAAADLANYRRRSEQDRSELMRNANADLIRRLLPILDDMERAFQSVPAEISALPWVDGMRLIQRKLLNTLEQEGVTPYDPVGEEFDPAYHEAVTYEPSEAEQSGKVIGVAQKGYRMRDRVLRPALVRVGRGPAA